MTSRRPPFFVILSGLLLCSGCARFSGPGDFHKDKSFISIPQPAGQEKLSYEILHYPGSEEKKFPLLYILHGSGMNGSRYLKQWEKESVKHEFLVVAPLRSRGYRNDPENLRGLYLILEKILAEYPVDSDRVYLAGVSSGALIARWMMLEKPQLWKGVILIANEPYEDWMSGLDKASPLPPILFVHGEMDDSYPFLRVRDNLKKLREKGAKVSLLADPKAGHEHREEWNEQIFEWIQEKE
jgi:poly(3-hydroxybutyrate) depolymerase